MIITKMSLPRRAFLRGAGATLALPFLDAMVPALSAIAHAAAAPRRRLGFVYIPNGVNWMKWTPEGEGKAFALSSTLSPLAPFREQLTVISQLRSEPAEAQGDGSGDHARASGAWLTGVHPKKTEGTDARAGKTVDQIVADELGRDTQFPSLQLAIDDIGMLGGCEPSYACAYQNTLSWRTATMPMPMQTNPRVVFERLLGGDARTAEERRALAREQGSLLDSLSQETQRLMGRLGGGDRARLDEYLGGIRELERRIEKLEHQQDEVALSSATLPIGIPDQFEEHVKLMFDLQVLAYQADLTRVITFMMSREATQRTYPQIGISDPHHGLSHHAEDPEKLVKIAKIDTYHVSLFAYFLGKLQGTRDGDGTLLDNLLIMYGSCMSNGQVHSHTNLPTLLAGGAGGRLKGGRHVVATKDTPLTNLQLRLMEKVDVRLDKFGDSTGPLVDV
jgi:hypothetical protein